MCFRIVQFTYWHVMMYFLIPLWFDHWSNRISKRKMNKIHLRNWLNIIQRRLFIRYFFQFCNFFKMSIIKILPKTIFSSSSFFSSECAINGSFQNFKFFLEIQKSFLSVWLHKQLGSTTNLFFQISDSNLRNPGPSTLSSVL